MRCSSFKDDSFAYNHVRHKPGEVKGVSPQTHNAYEIILLNNCEITYGVEEKSYHVKPNSLIVAPPGKLHSIRVDERWGYDRFNIMFDPKSVNAEVLSQIPKDLDVFAFEEDTTVLSLFAKMEHYCRYFEGFRARGAQYGCGAWEILSFAEGVWYFLHYNTNPGFLQVLSENLQINLDIFLLFIV